MDEKLGLCIEGGTYVFDNRVSRKTFGPTKDEETGKYSRLYNEKIHDMYFAPYILVGETAMKETTWKAYVYKTE